MLTIRSFRNEDPPRLLELWHKTQQRQDNFPPLLALSFNQLQTQMLGLPMLDSQSVMLAVEGTTPVGYVHTAFAPSVDGYSFDYRCGHVCFLCVDPQYSDVPGAATALIRAGERYLTGFGVRTIFGGSPSPSVPFYTGFYGGAEAIGILRSDEAIVNAFRETNYQLYHETTWFHFDLCGEIPAISADTIGYYNEFEVEIKEIPKARTWWEGCAFSNGVWFDATAYQLPSHRPVARLRTRVTYPDAENLLMMYSGTWLASLMELRVHPDFSGTGITQHLLEELIRYLAVQNQVRQVEAHAPSQSLLGVLLHEQSWSVRDSGYVFIKTVEHF